MARFARIDATRKLCTTSTEESRTLVSTTRARFNVDEQKRKHAGKNAVQSAQPLALK
jgi:hypothetical protein